jgi:hypothetical protein
VGESLAEAGREVENNCLQGGDENVLELMLMDTQPFRFTVCELVNYMSAFFVCGSGI